VDAFFVINPVTRDVEVMLDLLPLPFAVAVELEQVERLMQPAHLGLLSRGQFRCGQHPLPRVF
jgi:hypothetical protein